MLSNGYIPADVAWSVDFGLPPAAEVASPSAQVTLRYTDADIAGLDESSLQVYAQTYVDDVFVTEHWPNRNLIEVVVSAQDSVNLALGALVTSKIFSDAFDDRVAHGECTPSRGCRHFYHTNTALALGESACLIQSNSASASGSCADTNGQGADCIQPSTAGSCQCQFAAHHLPTSRRRDSRCRIEDSHQSHQHLAQPIGNFGSRNRQI